MKKKLLYLMSCWIIFIGLFMLAHSILSKIIMYYQRMPAIETAQAYQLISRYKQSVINFYQETGRCPTMKDKKQIIPKIEAYTYTSINSIYTIKECRGNSLPDSFLKALAMYKRNMR